MIRYFLRFFWHFLMLFFLARILFLIVNSSSLWNDLLLLPIITFKALPLDLSIIAYMAVIPLVLFLVQRALKFRLAGILLIYYFLISALTVVICAIDPFYFKYWGLKINFLALQYSNDTSGWSSISGYDYALAIMFAALILLYTIRKRKKLSDLAVKFRLVTFIVLLFGLGLMIRGGVGQSTVGISTAYFSEKAYINVGTLNPVWNLMAYEVNRSYTQELSLVDKDQLVIPESSEFTIDKKEYFHSLDSANVILVILEGVNMKTSQVIHDYPRKIMPNLDELSAESIWYSKAYAHSFRSDKGLAALLQGLPGLARVNLADFPDLLSRKPDLFNAFKQRGYSTLALYGGDFNFANIKVLHMGAEQVLGKEAFNEGKRSVWGYHDEYIYPKALSEIKKMKQPFFMSIYTISTHEPLKVPSYQKFPDPYENALAYADSCLGLFIAQLKEQGIWDESLLIITADHGSVRPDQLSAPESENYNVPVILSGGVVKKPLLVKQIVSHMDIAGTLNGLFGLGVNFTYSADLLQPRNYAFYNFYDGIVLKSNDCEQWFDLSLNKYLKGPCEKPYEKLFFQEAQKEFFSPIVQ